MVYIYLFYINFKRNSIKCNHTFSSLKEDTLLYWRHLNINVCWYVDGVLLSVFVVVLAPSQWHVDDISPSVFVGMLTISHC